MYASLDGYCFSICYGILNKFSSPMSVFIYNDPGVGVRLLYPCNGAGARSYPRCFNARFSNQIVPHGGQTE